LGHTWLSRREIPAPRAGKLAAAVTAAGRTTDLAERGSRVAQRIRGGSTACLLLYRVDSLYRGTPTLWPERERLFPAAKIIRSGVFVNQIIPENLDAPFDNVLL
jgi:hypothetical protein